MRDARDDEAGALRGLAHLPADHRRRDRLEQIAEDAYKRQGTIEARRRSVPKRAPLRDTELSHRLRYHPGHYKIVIDTLRIALANAETDLADSLAPHLRNPCEAKKTLANLLTAAGTVRTGSRHIIISLEPAAATSPCRASRPAARSASGSQTHEITPVEVWRALHSNGDRDEYCRFHEQQETLRNYATTA